MIAVLSIPDKKQYIQKKQSFITEKWNVLEKSL